MCGVDGFELVEITHSSEKCSGGGTGLKLAQINLTESLKQLSCILAGSLGCRLYKRFFAASVSTEEKQNKRRKIGGSFITNIEKTHRRVIRGEKNGCGIIELPIKSLPRGKFPSCRISRQLL